MCENCTLHIMAIQALPQRAGGPVCPPVPGGNPRRSRLRPDQSVRFGCPRDHPPKPILIPREDGIVGDANQLKVFRTHVMSLLHNESAEGSSFVVLNGEIIGCVMDATAFVHTIRGMKALGEAPYRTGFAYPSKPAGIRSPCISHHVKATCTFTRTTDIQAAAVAQPVLAS